MLNVVVVGLGPIGIAAAAAVRADSGMSLTAMLDLDPAKLGKSLGELSGSAKDSGPVITKDLGSAKADIAIITTASHFDKVAPTLRTFIAKRIHIVSSCEEMAWPRYKHPKLSDEIDAEAKKAGVALVGTGVNPGFVMDLLPLVLSSMVAKVTAVKVNRRVDASTRRKPLQAKVGSTMTVEHFNGLANAGNIGHMGLPESVAMIAAGLGHEAAPGSIKVTLDPIVAEKPMPSMLGTIEPGRVCGMHNNGKWSNESLSIELDLKMGIGVTDPHDSVELSGPVPLSLRINNGTPGDTATVASLINVGRLLPKLVPGLHTMLTIPAATARA